MSNNQPTCNTCNAYVGIVNKGKCCRKSPERDRHGVGAFPIVYGLIDWCAEHKPIIQKKQSTKKAPPPPPKSKK